ncbi:DUF4198 domain-containing protein [Phenylobacterium sp.]|uniref:DUF4198 domain-containing protein n=1 Tax=Phenylobacterium sp. TaxID=1871053 RepID=UPI00286BDDE1|nr:DUF4198 domain-containing protein [Phenylobacterium sp.]
MRRLAIWCGCLLTLVLVQPALAHDFWLQPDAFWVAPGTETSMTLQVGHGAERQRSAIPLGRITRFVAMAPSGATIDLRPSLGLGGAEADGAFGLQAPGVHVLALETDVRARSHLSADRFNAYLKEEGLTPALEQRALAGRLNAAASERYGRVAKAIVQVGDPGTGAQVTQAVGLSLEIVPEVNPYADPRPATLPVRVLFEGAPLAGALVKLTDLDHDEAPLAMHRTDVAGRASFLMPEGGRWRLNVVWTKPLAPGDDADFQTVFSSLTFGFPTATLRAGTPKADPHRSPGTPR